MMEAAEMDRQLETSLWLRKHGRAVRPHLNREQKRSLQDCFELIDADASGGLDLAELQQVFQALGDRVPMKEIAAMLAGIDADSSGRIDYAEFVSVMTSDKAAKRAEAQGSTRKPHKPHLFNLKLMAQAYARKKALQGVMFDADGYRALLLRKYDKAEAEQQTQDLPLWQQTTGNTRRASRQMMGSLRRPTDGMMGSSLTKACHTVESVAEDPENDDVAFVGTDAVEALPCAVGSQSDKARLEKSRIQAQNMCAPDLGLLGNVHL